VKLPRSNSRTIYLLAYPDSATSSSKPGYFTVLLQVTYPVIYLPARKLSPLQRALKVVYTDQNAPNDGNIKYIDQQSERHYLPTLLSQLQEKACWSKKLNWVVPCVRRLVTGLSARRIGLNTSVVYVGFMVAKLAVGYVFYVHSHHCKQRLLASSCQSVRMENLDSHWKDFLQNFIRDDFSKICRGNSNLIKISQD
jgi:hypothetical protein